jgi:Rieske Fe-S protein
MSYENSENSVSTADTDGGSEGSGPDRRTLIKAAALVGVPVAIVGGVAACSNGASSAPKKAAGPVVVPIAGIAVGGGVIPADSGVVVTQPTAGNYKAFTSTCTHAGCTVNQVQNNQIICPCHQSVYSAETGAVLDGPAPLPLTELTATISGANIDVTGLSS